MLLFKEYVDCDSLLDGLVGLTFSIFLLPGVLIFMARNFGGAASYEGERVVLYFLNRT
jgi:hypothetical protein